MALLGVTAVLSLVVAAAMLLELYRSPSIPFNGTVLDPPQVPTDFALQNQRGEIFRLADARGKVVVLTFLYTSCTDVCPFIGVKFRQAFDMLGEEARGVVFVAASVDPARDTPERISEYSRALGLYEAWHYLIGTEDELDALWHGYYVGTPTVTAEESTPASDSDLQFYGLLRGLDDSLVDTANRARIRFGGGYDVGHSSPVWLIDQEQRLRVKLGQDLDPAELVEDIRELIREAAD